MSSIRLHRWSLFIQWTRTPWLPRRLDIWYDQHLTVETKGRGREVFRGTHLAVGRNRIFIGKIESANMAREKKETMA